MDSVVCIAFEATRAWLPWFAMMCIVSATAPELLFAIVFIASSDARDFSGSLAIVCFVIATPEAWLKYFAIHSISLTAAETMLKLFRIMWIVLATAEDWLQSFLTFYIASSMAGGSWKWFLVHDCGWLIEIVGPHALPSRQPKNKSHHLHSS